MLFCSSLSFFSPGCQAYRLQQAIHNEIANKLKSIDKLRAAAAIIPAPMQTSSSPSCRYDEDGKMMAWKITEQKNKIAELLKMLAYLKELLQNVPHISIDSFLDLLMHKFHVIETESTVNDLLNLDIQKVAVSTARHHHRSNSSPHLHEPSMMMTATDDISSAYLNDILRRCSELQQSKEEPNEMDTTVNSTLRATEMNDDMLLMRDIWPDIMDRLENYLDNRKKQIKVDLKRLTSEEEAMVESVRNECVENIIEEICFDSK